MNPLIPPTAEEVESQRLARAEEARIQAARIQEITRKIPIWKGQTTAVTNFLALQRLKPLDETAVKNRMAKYESLFANFDDLMEELEQLDTNTDFHNPPDRSNIEANYYAVLTEAQRVLKQLPENSERSTSNASPAPSNTESATVRRRIKLPESTLPTFRGDHAQWISFKTEFDSMIGSQTDLSDTDKLHYLRSSLKGDALRKVQMLSITEHNYNRTWEMLETAYSDKRVIASRHLQCLIHLPKQEKEDSQGLSRLVDDTRQHLESLKAMNVTLEQMVVALLEDKIHRSTADAWDDKQVRGVFPELEKMLEFLSRRSTRLLTRPKERPSQPNARNARGNGKKKWGSGKQAAQAFVSTTSTCSYCKEAPHPVYRCGKFLKLTVPQRIKTCQDIKVCPKCLRDGHQLGECDYQACRKCGAAHNSLLHPPAASQGEPRREEPTTSSN